MEWFLWAFVFVAWAVWLTSEGEEMTWYIIGIKSHKNGSLQLDEVDAILCECTIDALTYAKQRYRTKYGQSLYAEACLTMRHIKRAKLLHNQHRLDDQVNNWTDADWREFEAVPTYTGNPNKYLASGVE
jgi:hypothetical protein